MSEFRFFTPTDFFDFQINGTPTFFNLPITLSTKSPHDPDAMSEELNIPYTVFEILVAIFAIVGNLMVIIVFQRERKLRRRTNYYIVSLAMADFLVGSLGVPFAILSSVGMPQNLYACLFTVSLLVVLCTISIFCLVAVSVDRYWAILYPMAYSRNVRTKTAIIIISMCWVAGTVVGFLPLFGWHADVGNNHTCHFVKVMDYSYLVFLYFATIITPAILMLAFYAHIYRVIIKQVRQIVTMNPVGDSSRRSSTSQITMTTPSSRPCHGGTMLRVLGASRKRDVKATQNLSIIVLFFMICWFPLYTINCIKAFCNDCEVHPKLTLFCIILSHLNSAGNPVLYAYHLKDFRLALKNLILKIMGVEMEPHAEAIHRFSLASQHRLQSIDANMRNSLQPRVYVDSPIWLRQQQEKALKNPPKCGVVTPCLNNIHQTVAAVASVTTDIERQMWNIVEASSGAELDEVNYEFPENTLTQNTPPTPPPRQYRPTTVSSATSAEQGGSSAYSYDNCNYHSSQEETDDFDEVFLPNNNNNSSRSSENKDLNNSSIGCSMHEKLRSDDAEYQSKMHSRQNALTDSSYSDYEIPKENTQKHLQTGNGKLLTASPKTATPPPPKKPPRLAQQQQQQLRLPNMNALQHKPSTVSQSSSSTSCLTNSAIYVIDNDTTPLSPTPAHKRRFKKSTQRLPMNFTKTTKTISRSCSCTNDSSSPIKELPAALKAPTTTSTDDSNSNSSLSVAAASGGGSGENGIVTANNNSQTINNLNYYTFHHPHQLPHTLQYHTDKFSPLKAMSHILLPPIVKHSSLFQLFQPTFPTESDINSCSETTTTEIVTITTTIATTANLTAATTNPTIDDATKKLSNELRIASSNVSNNSCATVTTTDVVDSPRTSSRVMTTATKS